MLGIIVALGLVWFVALPNPFGIGQDLPLRYDPPYDRCSERICDQAPRPGNRLLDLSFADNAEIAEEIVDSWPKDRSDARRAVLGDLVAGMWLTALVGLGTFTFWPRRRYRVAAVIALLALGAALIAHAVENVSLSLLIGDDAITEAAVDRVRWPATLKLGLFIPSALFAVIGAATWPWWSRSRRDEQHEGSAGPERDEIWDRASQPPRTIEFERQSRRRAFVDWLATRQPTPIVPPPWYRLTGEPGQLGISCSGGGIRSAAFNLGALQALQERGELRRAKYLSAVSGGSYIASAFAIVEHREQQRRRDDGAQATTPFRPFERGSPEEHYLRTHCDYLAPRLGGKWYLAWRVLRGLSVNLVLLALVLMTLGLPLGWIVERSQRDGPAPLAAIQTIHSAAVQVGYDASVTDGGVERRLRRGSTVEVVHGGIAAASESPVLADDQTLRPRDRLSKGTTRYLAPEQRIRLNTGRLPLTPNSKVVHARGGGTTVGQSATVDLGQHARLTAPAGTTVRLEEDAIVGGRGGRLVLSKACGVVPCREYDRPGWLIPALVVLGAVTVALGLFGLLTRPMPGETSFPEAWSTRFLNLTILLAGVGLGIPLMLTTLQNAAGQSVRPFAGVSAASVVSIIAALVVDAGAAGTATQAATTSATVRRVVDLGKKLAQRLRSLFMTLAAAVAGPALVLIGLLAFGVQGAVNGLDARAAAVALGSLCFLGLAWASIDLNAWSLNPFYRARLASEFSIERAVGADDVASAKPVNPDELALRDICPQEFPKLIVCAAANVTDLGVTAPGRPVCSFTYSNSGIGGPLLGHFSPDELSRAMGGAYKHQATLPAAVAVSGAALSPAMGKMTRWHYRFLLALANVRLGVWLPNPLIMRRAKHVAERQARPVVARQLLSAIAPSYGASPPSQDQVTALVGEARDAEAQDAAEWTRRPIARPHYLLRELIGLHSYKQSFVYVTDGGHYENLGLVELLRRGCTQIYCFDAAGDTVDTFSTVGQAVALARAELGIDIEIQPARLAPTDDGKLPRSHVVGVVRFAGQAEPTGWIVFAKACVPDDAPADVKAYHASDPQFPTHGTIEQLYTDAKFEAYRALGYHIASGSAATMATLLAAEYPETAIRLATQLARES